MGVGGKGEVERGLRGRGVVGVDFGRRARGVLGGVSMCCGIGKRGGGVLVDVEGAFG